MPVPRIKALALPPKSKRATPKPTQYATKHTQSAYVRINIPVAISFVALFLT